MVYFLTIYVYIYNNIYGLFINLLFLIYLFVRILLSVNKIIYIVKYF